MPLSNPGLRTGRFAPAANTRPAIQLTDEQNAIMGAYHEKKPRIVVTALAGTGKTTTLRALAADSPRRPGVYLAFNKSVVLESEGKFPDAVEVTTAHSLAYQAVGRAYAHRLPGNGSRRLSAQEMARRLKVRALSLDGSTLNPVVVTKIAQATVAAFMKTADPHLMARHIPDRALALGPVAVTEAVLPVARAIWTDLTRTDGMFYFTHDVYLKLWQLRNPRLPFDYVMFDEAQDADPVIASIVAAQGAQTIYVGDENQAIYGWRGAVDAMSKVEDAARFPLTRSYRFGPAIADQANAWLDLIGTKLRVVGNPALNSTVEPLAEPRAILTRTNGTALGWVLSFHKAGIPVALAPGTKQAGKDIERFAWAARDLMRGEGTDHPDLVGFPDWQALTKFVEEEEDTADLKRMVGIVNAIGPGGVIDAVRGLVPEQKARVTVSTAHKAKGLEWESVKVGDDFTPPDPDGDEAATPEDRMLAYVTVTRAKNRLDPGALAEPSLWR